MFNTRKTGLLAAVCSAGLLVAASAAQAETLADAIALAYQTNPTLQEQRANQRALDENYVQARTGLRPTVGANLQVVDRETKLANPTTSLVDTNGDGIPDSLATTDTIRSNSSAGTLSVTQPLYTGGRVTARRSNLIWGAERVSRAGRRLLNRPYRPPRGGT